MYKTCKIIVCIVFTVLCFSHGNLHAVVTFDWATVGNPGNAGEVQFSGTFGAVDYTYRISKYEVTNDQYTEFLNAVDAFGTNPNNVYDSSMGNTDPWSRGGIDFIAGATNGAKYTSKINFGNKPVNFVSFFDSMRFVNWLENGQPTDGSGTESGVYTIGTGINETRAASATFFIPNEDEWYKAAYYDPRSAAQGGPPGDDNYWQYPTSSDIVPTVATANAVGDISNPGTNVANYSMGADWNGQNGNVTSVGSAGAGSASFYGTFDQGGNIIEWNTFFPFPNQRSGWGGGWYSYFGLLVSSGLLFELSPNEAFNELGLRIARSTFSCDFTDDDICNVTDLDLMQSLGPIATGIPATGNEEFDLNGDDVIDLLDRDEWLANAAAENGFGSPYKLGDATLDGAVDGSDFIAWSTAKFTANLLWSKGNFNADSVVDGQDLLLWNGNKFTSSDGVSAVPEPGTGMLSLVAMLLLGSTAKQR